MSHEASAPPSSTPAPGGTEGGRPPLVGWAVPVTATIVALLVAVPAASLSGAAAPLALGDAGPLVRWGLPVVRIVHDLAAALTIGLLLVAAFLTREGTSTRRRETAAQMAFLSSIVWLFSAAVVLYLTLGQLAGIPPSSSFYLSELFANAWALPFLRLYLGVVLLVIPVVALTAYARTRGALAWTFVLALVALVPLAFTGHSAGAVGHETTVTALNLHLVGMTVWVGGLMAIAALLPVLGTALPDTVRRFSTVATWCYATVAVSGVLFATVTVGSLDNLATPYGVVLLLKVALLALLGVGGYLQRTAVIARGVDSPARFGRIAAGEVVLMSAAVALGVVLGRSPTPEAEVVAITPAIELTGWPMPEPFTWARLFLTWRTDWLFTFAALVAIGLYVAGFLKLRRRGDSWPVHKLVLWVLGWAVFMWVTSGGPGVYGRVMFSVHMVAHMTLMMAVPILLVPANGITLALRALPARRDKTLGAREILLAVVHSRWAAFVVNPVVAGLLFFGSLVVFYWSPMLEWALTTHVGHLFMVVHFTLTGYAFVWSLVGTDPGPPKWPAPLRVIVLLATLAGHAFFALALMQGSFLLAPEFYKTLAVPWVPDLLADQQLGGTIAWGVGELPTVVLMLMVVLDWYRRDTREAVRADRQADRDNDAELAAYNERLRAMSRRPKEDE
jgi:cytochrome c oxidase assembly factor CtaG/putative copper export protein